MSVTTPVQLHPNENVANPCDPEKIIEPAPPLPSRLRLLFLGFLTLVAFVGLGFMGVRARSHQWAEQAETKAGTADQRMRVLTVVADKAPSRIERVLPGTARPEQETAVYARTSGYLRRWHVDIGDQVKEGQLLAEIETPEVDGQFLQAKATLAESQAALIRNKASADLARLTHNRTRQVYMKGAVAVQEFDEAEASMKVALAAIQVTEATVQASEANVKRLEDLRQFQKVTAPFAGVVTARNYDLGALIVADNATARELFHLARIDRLRVYADVPQTYATAVRPGQPAPVSRPEVPGREFAGTVARTTNTVDLQTRTLRVEVAVPNEDLSLLPGMYLQVRFQLDSSAKLVRVPGAAVVIRAEGAKVAVVDSVNRVSYRTVKLGRDYGSVVEVTEGLTGGERLVVRPGDDLDEGTTVEPVVASDRS